ncbi:MAG: LCP family protein [Anaerolineae bacterium]
MAQKLRVPPPRSRRPEYRPGAGQQRRPDAAPPDRRRGASGCWLPVVAAIVVGCLVLTVCLLSSAVPGLLAPGQGGHANLLLLGIDRRGGDDWTYRTDTIMVIGLDAQKRSANILSIPRDLQVPIPGYGEDRINTANVYGYLYDFEGGGPGLLRSTVEANFGIPVDGYVMLDFHAFEDIVDALGGIEVDVQEPLHDTRYPDPRPGDPHAYKTIHFDAGVQHMDGQRALEYARSRMSTSDFDRARRQQQILLAVREKALNLGAIPHWPALARIVLDAAKTDLGGGQMLGLALLAARLDPANLEQVVLERPYVTGYRRADGAAVQLPNWDLINPVVTGMFPSR